MKYALVMLVSAMLQASAVAQQAPCIMASDAAGNIDFVPNEFAYHEFQFSLTPGGPWLPTGVWNVSAAGTNVARVCMPFALHGVRHCFFRGSASSSTSQVTYAETDYWGSLSDLPICGSIEGSILFFEGNFMPGSGDGTITGVRRWLFVFARTLIADTVRDPNSYTFFNVIKTQLVGICQSDTNGAFRIDLPAGDYSLFVLERPNAFYANGFDGTAIRPIQVRSNVVSEVFIAVTYASEW